MFLSIMKDFLFINKKNAYILQARKRCQHSANRGGGSGGYGYL